MKTSQLIPKMTRDEQIETLYKGASLFGVPIVRHKDPDKPEAYYSITYTNREGQTQKVVTQLFQGEDFEFMEAFLERTKA